MQGDLFADDGEQGAVSPYPGWDEELQAAKRQLRQVGRVVVYTDGNCSGNPGPGGWGVLLLYREAEAGTETETRLEVCGGELDTTNNRMELLAALRALELLPIECDLTLYTDSQYLQKGMTQWLPGWKRKNWRTAARKPVRNADLWKRLDSLVRGRQVAWKWVRGHVGVEGNERADWLARQGMEKTLERAR